MTVVSILLHETAGYRSTRTGCILIVIVCRPYHASNLFSIDNGHMNVTNDHVKSYLSAEHLRS